MLDLTSRLEGIDPGRARGHLLPRGWQKVEGLSVE